jgi:hypothetical protein
MSVTIPDVVDVNIGETDSPINRPFNIKAFEEAKGDVAWLFAHGVRNMLRDRKASLKSDDPEWHALAEKTLARWQANDFGGGERLSAFVKVARTLLFAKWPKGKGSKVNGKTREEVAGMGEADLKKWLGPARVAKVEAMLKADAF